MKARTIDERDRQILTIIQDNGRISNAEIARQVGMAPSAVLERVRKLERSGVVEGYEAVINPKAAGKPLTAFTQVHCEEGVGSTDTGQLLAELPEVLEVHYTAGADNYLVKLRVDDTEALHRSLTRFGTIPGVRDTRTVIVLTTVKESRRIDLSSKEAAGDGD